MTLGSVLIAIDAGNSAVKIVVRGILPGSVRGSVSGTGNRPDLNKTFLLQDDDWAGQVCDWLQSTANLNASDDSMQCWVSTVNRSASEPLQCEIAERFPDVSWNVARYDTIPMKVDVEFPERVGIDRLLGGFAASSNQTQPVVVVDAGSAVTIDYVGRDQVGDLASGGDSRCNSVFLGGAILPGVRLQLAALANGTEAIEQIAFDVDATSQPFQGAFQPGRNTEDAIRLGVTAGLVGSVQRLVNDYATLAKDGSVSIVVTGGDAMLISRHLALPHIVRPQLVCDGLLLLAKSSQQNSPPV